MTGTVDIHAFPPDLPPNPDTDDIGGDELDRAGADHAPPPGPVTETTHLEEAAGAGATPTQACDYCGAPASLGIYYLADQSKEWVCYPCHAAMIAKALHEAADMSETGGGE